MVAVVVAGGFSRGNYGALTIGARFSFRRDGCAKVDRRRLESGRENSSRL